MKCEICGEEAVENGYCDLHVEAYKSVMKNYEVWKKALGLSWEEYLSEVAKNPLTGEWAKEVAQHLMKSGEKRVGTSN